MFFFKLRKNAEVRVQLSHSSPPSLTVWSASQLLSFITNAVIPGIIKQTKQNNLPLPLGEEGETEPKMLME